jgi:hypothetical protein
MPSKSQSQKKLMLWALACKKGDAKNCPKHVKELADSMTIKQLEDYVKTDSEDLPQKVKESLELSLEQMNESELEELDKIDESNGSFSGATRVTVSNVEGMGDVTPPPPGGVDKGSGDAFPSLFTPSTFKLPGSKKRKNERRIMDFEQFLKRINYRTHDDDTQTGLGKNPPSKNNPSK